MKDKTTFFGTLHPATLVLYYFVVLSMIMFTNRIELVSVFLVTGTIYGYFIKSKQWLISTLKLDFIIVFIAGLLKGFFSHNGKTVLFYINTNRITLESILYGLVLGMIVITMLTWFVSFNHYMTSDKLIYIFGKLGSVLGLMISMIFRFIPLLKQREQDVLIGQKSMRLFKDTYLEKMKALVQRVDILIGWSLEASIESADSMVARGYGLPGRSSFHLFKIKNIDIIFTTITLILAIISFFIMSLGYARISYFPEICTISNDSFNITLIIFAGIIGLMPLLLDLYGEFFKWKK